MGFFLFTVPTPKINLLKRHCAVIAMLFLLLDPSTSQPRDDERVIGAVSFVGNETYPDDELASIVRSKESPSSVLVFLNKISFGSLGSPRLYFDQPMFVDDVTRLKTFYENEGFYRTEISHESVPDSAERSIELRFIIREGSRSHIDSITYVGLDTLPSALYEMLRKDPLIRKHRPYERLVAEAEINRILGLLVNNGHPAARFNVEKSAAEHIASTNNFRLILVFEPGPRYNFGDITIVEEPERDDIRDHLIVRELDFKPGELYSHEKERSSERNLNRLDLFESAYLDHPQLTETTYTAAVPINIRVRPRDRHEVAPEVSVSDENNSFNLGLGAAYTNRNFFGDARSFHVRSRVRTQSLGEVFRGTGLRDTFLTGAVELEFQVRQPFLFRRSLSGSWISSVSAEKQRLFILSILRNKIGVTNRYTEHTYAGVEWTLERVSPEILPSLADSQALRDPTTILAGLSQEEQRQFNSILTLSLSRDKTNDLFSPTGGFFQSVTLEESGLLPLMLPRLRGELPFTQYYKVTLFGRWYRDLTSTEYNILALKLKVGYQEKYGQSRGMDINIPLNRRYFGGGSGSVRGWKARQLGAMSDALLEIGGNLVLEGNVEMRINYFRGKGKLFELPLDNIWGVYFLDFGNVWRVASDFRIGDIAAAAGVGLRYDTFFGPFRVDYGFRIYDPKGADGRTFIIQKRFIGETLSEGVLHFGIGHAF